MPILWPSRKGGKVSGRVLGSSINAVKHLKMPQQLNFDFWFLFFLFLFKLDLIIELDKERKKIVNSIGILTD